jgi:hypothetical protein
VNNFAVGTDYQSAVKEAVKTLWIKLKSCTADEYARECYEKDKCLGASHLMSVYIGLDVHKDWTFVTVLNQTSRVVVRESLRMSTFQVS